MLNLQRYRYWLPLLPNVVVEFAVLIWGRKAPGSVLVPDVCYLSEVFVIFSSTPRQVPDSTSDYTATNLTYLQFMFSLCTFLAKEIYWLMISPLCLFPPNSAFELLSLSLCLCVCVCVWTPLTLAFSVSYITRPNNVSYCRIFEVEFRLGTT
jgi:hypothetical protein